MPLLQPSSCTCYHLKPPQLPNSSEYASLDQYTKKKISLECRTGAAVDLSRSNIFVHGGLTVPLNLETINILQLQKELLIYFSKINNDKINFENLRQWLSSEVFYLDLISRSWHHVKTSVDSSSVIQNELLDHDESKSPLECPLKGRLFHSMCYFDSALYIFGGLIVSPQTGYELIATNELWKLDIKTKTWKFISNNAKITRRFNHSMHLKNEDVDTRDTKLIIVGGIDNTNEPVKKIDVYNLSQNCWQYEVIPKDDLELTVNINNNPISLLAENDFSILVENNEAKIPALVIYKPNNQAQEEQDYETEISSNFEDKTLNSEKMISPMTTLPLISNSKGMKLAYNNLQSQDILRESFNLQFPSGQYFGYNIIIGGFYPNCKVSNFCCFVYDISSGRWTRISIKCPESDIIKHRFWKLFVWKSHHQTLLLGTNKNDGYLPSVQKFDHILVFGLPLINAFNKVISSPHASNLQKRNQSLYSINSFQTNLDDTIQQQLIFENGEQHTRNASYASSVSSQFENYIRYISPSFELSSVRTTFPPYAMVLGKDALDVYGDYMSDFEFITSEGDIVGVPMYLLRKRWGRYFNFLLSKGYSKICLENEMNMKRSTLLQHSPVSSRLISRDSSRQGSLDFFRDSAGSSFRSNKDSPRSSNGLDRSFSGSHKSFSQLFMNDVDDNTKYFNKPKILSHPLPEKTKIEPDVYSRSPENDEIDINDPVSLPRDDAIFTDKLGDLRNNPIKRTATTSTTSSTSGMVFRLPFQENDDTITKEGSPLHKQTDERRRSSFVEIPTNLNNDFQTSRRNSAFHRRASHPVNMVKFKESTSPSLKQYKRAPVKFPNSARSSISYASLSSNKKRNSLPSLGYSNSFPNISLDAMNIQLPPRSKTPVEPLPGIPMIRIDGGRPSTSIYDFNLSNKNSPFSSRRVSFVSANSNPEWRNVPALLNNLTLDEKLLQKNEELNHDKPFPTLQSSSQLKSHVLKKSSGSIPNNLSNTQSISDKTRHSVISNPESNDSRLSNNAYDMEPLLVPRSLYMPWPKSSVKALAEYFYTGQMNGKWLLAPVALDLLVMAKLYEIPLLYSLIAETLYSILGRKEEGLFVACTSLRNRFLEQIKQLFHNDEKKVEYYLTNSETYKRLLKLHKALIEIDNGFLNYDLLRKSSRNNSFSTHDSSDSEDPYKKVHRVASTGSFNNYKQSIISFDSKDGRSSLGSTGFSPLNFQDPKNSMSATSPRVKKKSSLSKEINPLSFYFEDDFDIHKFKNRVKEDSFQNIVPDSFKPNFDDYDLGIELSTSSSDETSDESENELETIQNNNAKILKRVGSNPEFQSSTIIDTTTTKEEGEVDYNHNIDNSNSPSKNKTPKALLNNYVDSGLGMASLSKLKKKVQEGGGDLDESVDPLFKINSTLKSPGRPQSGPGRPSITRSIFRGSVSGLKSPKDTIRDEDYSMLRLEYIVSANALPPVDYIIKHIYKTAVLVNDIKMTIRCIDCLEISKELRAVKKLLEKEVTKNKNETKPNI